MNGECQVSSKFPVSERCTSGKPTESRYHQKPNHLRASLDFEIIARAELTPRTPGCGHGLLC
jgi:hypothetical protein